MPEEMLEAYLDGDLSPDEAEELERRLESSPALRRELDLAREIRRALRQLPAFDASPETLERVRRETTGSRRSSRSTLALAAGLTMAAIGLFTWKALDRSPIAPELDPAVVQAAEEARWVLAQVDRLTRKAGRRVRDDVVAKYVVAPTRRGVASALDLPRPLAASELRIEERDDA